MNARPPISRRRSWALALAAVLASCSTTHVSSVDPAKYEAIRRGDALGAGALSLATDESLRVLGLAPGACRGARPACLQKLAEATGIDDEARLAALSELWLAAAAERERARPIDRARVIEAYLESARAAYAYLFFTERSVAERAFDARQSDVRDFYDLATERVAILLFEDPERRGAPPAALAERPFRARGWSVRAGVLGVRLPAGATLDELVATSRSRASGIRNVFRRDGLGAAVVAVARTPTEGLSPSRSPAVEPSYLAATVVLRFPGDSLSEVLSAREATLDAFDSIRRPTVAIHGVAVPLAANFTAPYALWLERSRFGREAKRAFLPASEDLVEARVLLTQPYDPERSTIVLVHGLASSPEAWIDLANELLGDETIRERYQIWQVFYRTSAPIAYNERAIRAALEATLSRYDPGRTAPASHDLVVVGHSMGGVLARLLVVEAGDRLWTALLGHAPDPAERERWAALAPFLDLAPMPEVGRAVFLAAPHRGAPLAGSWLGRLAARWLRLPASIGNLAHRLGDSLAAASPETAARLRSDPDGVQSLSDRGPYLRATAELPIPASVPFHSILGCARPVDELARCSDGLVPYASAHLDGAASELVVRSRHHVQESPDAILELRRILRLHLRELDCGRPSAGTPGSRAGGAREREVL